MTSARTVGRCLPNRNDFHDRATLTRHPSRIAGAPPNRPGTHHPQRPPPGYRTPSTSAESVFTAPRWRCEHSTPSSRGRRPAGSGAHGRRRSSGVGCWRRRLWCERSGVGGRQPPGRGGQPDTRDWCSFPCKMSGARRSGPGRRHRSSLAIGAVDEQVIAHAGQSPSAPFSAEIALEDAGTPRPTAPGPFRSRAR